MTCQHYRELMTDFQHRELDAAADAAVYEHLQSCEECRAESAANSALTESLRAAFATELEMPTSILAGVRQAVRRDKTAGIAQLWRAVLRPAVFAPTAAVVVLAAGIVSYVGSNTASEAPQLSAEYYVRQHVAHTMNSQSGDRAWNAYLLTSNTGDNANAPAP